MFLSLLYKDNHSGLLLFPMLFEKGPARRQVLHDPVLEKAGVELRVQREDELHPAVSGNKIRKLKYHVQQAQFEGKRTLLTFGGAFSNHIAATAAAGKLLGFGTIGIIRGEAHEPLNPTLAQAVANGMVLHYLDRTAYRSKEDEEFLQQLSVEHGHPYIIPEGGSGPLGVKGCSEMLEGADTDFDVVCCACGTGATMAGLMQAIHPTQRVLGFPVIKGGASLYKDITAMAQVDPSLGTLAVDYHFGGYAKVKSELVAFMEQMMKQHQLPLDPVYTGKLFYGIFDQVRKGFFSGGTRLLAIHTGGLQGVEGMRWRGLM